MSASDPKTDPRVRRTRHSVVDAFADLARERPYDEIKVGDVVRGADVGRSTFYAHYRGKDDVLLQSLSMFYEMLADEIAAALRGDTTGKIEWMLGHFTENRLLARRLTTGPAAEAYERSLNAFGRMIVARLDQHCTEHNLTPRIPTPLLGAGLARASITMILDWVSERPGTQCSPADLADALRTFARGGLTGQLVSIA